MSYWAKHGAKISTSRRLFEDSTDSDNELDHSKSLLRRISTSKCMGRLPIVREGYLMKQQRGRFGRWRRRYFVLRGRTLYYAKTKESDLFEEFELEDATFAECDIKNVNHSFQVITTHGTLILGAESRAEMEGWAGAIRGAAHRGSDVADLVAVLSSGEHNWFTATHARPTFCNVCREPLGTLGTAHALSCELCKFKAHKRCAARAPPSCKWTTLASLAGDIIEEPDGIITMPHQWLEGNLPVAAKCAICDKTCGSVLRLQDFRCVWCRRCVHAGCRPHWRTPCDLGPTRASIVPPTHLHSVGPDDAWEADRPPGTSPILVFVNSKSGDNQGVKFLRRFKQLLNPAQVFELSGANGGPRFGLQLFRHFEPLRVLVCSGDGSVGWVLQEIDKLDMHKQCKVAVLPLGTGNDLARVLGWGGSCDETANLITLLERLEKASTKMLDRWSIMAFERVLAPAPPPPDPPPETSTQPQRDKYLEDMISSPRKQIIHLLMKQLKQVITGDLEVTALTDGVEKATNIIKEENRSSNPDMKSISDTTRVARAYSLLLQVAGDHVHDQKCRTSRDILPSDESEPDAETTDEKGSKEKTEKEIHNLEAKIGCPVAARAVNVWRELKALENEGGTNTSEGLDVKKLEQPDLADINVAITATSGSMCTLPAPRAFADGSRRSSAASNDAALIDREDIPDIDEDIAKLLCSNEIGNSEISANESPSLDDVCLTSTEDRLSIPTVIELRTNLNVPNLVISDIDRNISDSQRYESEKLTIIDTDTPYCELDHYEEMNKSLNERESERTISETDNSDMSDDDFSLMSEPGSPIAQQKEPTSETTLLNSETIHGESMVDDMSSVLGITAINQSDTYTDDTTIITSDTVSDIGLDSRNPSLDKYDESKMRFLTKQRNMKKEKFGFENRVFNLENKNDESSQVKYCSLAQFVEGNDIARKSFKRRSRRSKKLEKKVMPDLVIASEAKIDREEDETNANPQFPRVSVVVEPPSPSHSEEPKSIKSTMSRMAHVLNDFFDAKSDNISVKSIEIKGGLNVNLTRERRCSDNAANLLSSDPEYNKFLNCSPSATRRISCGSLFKPGEADKLSKSISSIWGLHDDKSNKDNQDKTKRLPIINPLVRLPAWPHVGGGLISQCLLANADALCAAVSPLMDPDETLMEGFDERAVMNNYFGIGIDAKIALDFHIKREEHPEKCRSRAKNYMWYGVLGSKEWLHRTYRHLGQRVQLECDGQRIPLPELQGIVVLNIPSFMGGTNFWGGTRGDELFLAPSFDDRILEVVAVFGSAQMAASRLINLQKHRIAQCRAVQINILGEECVPVQVDGEAWLQPPGCIRIIHKNRAQMLSRSRALETSFKSWDEKQQMKQHQAVTNPSNVNQEDAIPNAEAAQLLAFMDCANTFVKWVKLQSTRAGGTPAFSQARRASSALDALLDSRGRLLPASTLRRTLTHAVTEVKALWFASASLPNATPAYAACRRHLDRATTSQGLTYLQPESTRRWSGGTGAGWLRGRGGVADAATRPKADLASWGADEVGSWLHGLGLGEYAAAFAAHEVTGRELPALARRDLKDLGVNKVGHLRRLLHAIEELR